MTEVEIQASKTYSVLIERGLLASAGRLIREKCGGEKLCVVCGDTVRALYGAAMGESLRAAGYDVCFFTYPPGEPSKTVATYAVLLNCLAENGLTRTDTVIALGGGVTGDLAGFAAATFLRGIRYVQIPTTLLAMIDSSVGGKTAVDLPAGKNLAGAFWQPSAVLCDPDTLDTLPDEFFADGCAEAVKYAVLAAPELLELLKAPRANAQAVIEKCVAIKRDFVQRDEFDTGERQKLNLGHTVGHAIEKLSGFSVSHGRAVATGLAVMARAAAAHGACDAGTAEAVETALARLGLPTRTEYSAAALMTAMLSDKKRRGGTVALIVPRALGRCDIVPTPADALAAFFEKGL